MVLWGRPVVTGMIGVAYWLTAAASVPVGQTFCLGGTHLSQLSSILTIIPLGKSQLSIGQQLNNLIIALWILELESE